jgi:hypothetical protein
VESIGGMSSSLKKEESGIWVPAAELAGRAKLSFPDDGHEACFQLEDRSFWFEHRNRCILECLKKQKPQGPLLDIGGGNGAVSAALERGGIATVLMEPSAVGAGNAKKRGLKDVICATLEQASFAPGSFTAAGLFDVIEHLEQDSSFLSGPVHSVLRKNGLLCVTVPAYRTLWSSEDELAGHFRRYTFRGLRRVLEQSGFDVLFQSYFFAPLVLPMFLMRSLPHRLGRDRGQAEVHEGAAKQHTPSKLSGAVIRALLAPELFALSRGLPIPFGTSCIALARAR